MKLNWKKILSSFLALAMLLSLFPTTAFAEPEETSFDDAASVEAWTPEETEVYGADGAAGDPVGTARLEAACRFLMYPEKTVEIIHEEAAPEDGEEEVHQHVHVTYPYHNWRASLVVSFDRNVAAGSLGLATRCDNCFDGGVAGWRGFLLDRDLPAGSELQLKGGFGQGLSYGKLCEQVGEILCGAFNLSEENLGAVMTVSLRLHEQANGVETGRVYTLASYAYSFAEISPVQSFQPERINLEEGAAAPQGDSDGEEPGQPDGTQWSVELSSRTRENNVSICRLSGGGMYDDGSEATVTAYPRKGYNFVGWFDASDTAFENALSDQQSYTFTVTQDTSLVAIFEPSQGTLFQLTVHGSLYVVNNGAVQSDMSTYTYNVGERMYISYRDTTREFLYWVNASGNVLSTEKDFSFLLAADTEISSYYAANDTDDVTAMVIFRNAFKQVVLSRTYTQGQSIFFPPNVPNKMGYTFKGWYLADEDGEPSSTEATDESIHAAMSGTNAVIVVPDYVANGQEYTVTVEYTDGTNSLKDSISKVLGVGDSKTFFAPAIKGKVFQHWELNGVIAGFNKGFTVICAEPGEALLRAVYGDEAEEHEPTIIITQTYAKFDNGKYVVSNTEQYAVPARYTVMEVGFVYSTDGTLYGVAGGEENLKLDAPNTKKHLSGFTTNDGIYTFNARTSDPDKTVYAKAYMILKGPDGEILTYYSDMTAGSFNSLTNPEELNIAVVCDDDAVLQADAQVPQDTAIDESVIVGNTATLTIFVDDAEAAAVSLEETEQAKGYDVRIEGVKSENTALIIVTLSKAVPRGGRLLLRQRQRRPVLRGHPLLQLHPGLPPGCLPHYLSGRGGRDQPQPQQLSGRRGDPAPGRRPGGLSL